MAELALSHVAWLEINFTVLRRVNVKIQLSCIKSVLILIQREIKVITTPSVCNDPRSMRAAIDAGMQRSECAIAIKFLREKAI
jgi:hypothetical protein